MEGMNHSEYKACIDNLGLSKGERKELEYLIREVVFKDLSEKLYHLKKGYWC